ncbi:MAG TPA: hypothetical protein VGB87_17680 [Vicinamibacteria bacterium]
MNDDDYRRWVRLNLPHARTVAQRVARSLEALGAFGEASNGHAAPLAAAFDALEQRLRGFDEDPPAGEALRAADEAAALARVLVEAILGTPARSDRLGQNVRNLFECLGLADEGARLALLCGESPDSPLR